MLIVILSFCYSLPVKKEKEKKSYLSTYAEKFIKSDKLKPKPYWLNKAKNCEVRCGIKRMEMREGIWNMIWAAAKGKENNIMREIK